MRPRKNLKACFLNWILSSKNFDITKDFLYVQRVSGHLHCGIQIITIGNQNVILYRIYYT